MTAGKMDIDRRVERNARLAPARDLLGVALGVGRREFASGIAGACDEPGPDRIRLDREAERLDLRLRAASSLPVGTPEISRFCHTVSRISPSPISRAIVGKPAHLRDRQIVRPVRTTPIQCSPSCFCAWMPICAVRIERRTRRDRAGHRAVEFAAKLLLESTEEFLDAHRVEHVFQPRLGAVGTVAVIDEHAHHCVRDLACVGGLHDDAGVAREILVAREAAKAEPEPDAGLKPETVFHLHRLESDIVGILQHRNRAGAVEGDVELARQAVERPVVENMEVPFARIRPRVDQLLRIDTGSRRAGDVADIVGAGAARAQTEILDRLDHGDRILGRDFADLQIRARRDVRVAAAETFCEIGDAGKLRALRMPFGSRSRHI